MCVIHSVVSVVVLYCIIFIYGLYKDAFSIPDFIVSNGGMNLVTP
jgi:hypothetical protein